MLISSRRAALLLLPATAIFGVFVIYPLINGVLLSFMDSSGPQWGEFVGFDNYERMFSDPLALRALGNTIAYTVVVVVVQNALALLIAYGLYQNPRVRNLVRGSILLPAMMAFVAVAYLWSYIYNPLNGPLNSVLTSLGLGGLAQSWLGDPALAMWSIAAVYIWQFTGYSTTIYLANYLAISPSLMEAAQLDGAYGFKRFLTIDWRLLAPSFTINLTLTVIGSLRVFDLPFIMTDGGPANSTQTLSTVINTYSFSNFDFSYGTAIAVVLLILTVIAGVTQATLLRRREVDL